MQNNGASRDEKRKSLIDFYNGLIASYPHLYRVGGDEMASLTCRAWKVEFMDRYGHGALDWFTQKYIGKGFFENTPPRPHHACLLWEHRENSYFSMAERLDILMHTHYMSLYLKEPRSRIERTIDMASTLNEVEAKEGDILYVMAKVRRSAEWRSYPPSPYDIRSLIIRKRAGVGGCDEEFANYLQGEMTLGVKALCGAIGVDNLRVMGMETLSRVFKKMYFTLDEDEWKAVNRGRSVTDSDAKDFDDDVSRENTLALFQAKTD